MLLANMKVRYVRTRTSGERAALQAGLKSRSGFTVRRSQALLMDAIVLFQVAQLVHDHIINAFRRHLDELEVEDQLPGRGAASPLRFHAPDG